MRVLAESPWAFGWTAIAGIATALLAGVTWWLAKSTRDLAQETAQDIRSQSRPILLLGAEKAIRAVLVERSGEDESARIEMKIANRGRGPALNCVVHVESSASAYKCDFQDSFRPMLAVDEECDLELWGSAPQERNKARTHAFGETIVLTYRDVAENAYETRLVLTGGAPQYDKHLRALTASLGVKDTAIR